MTSPSPWSSDEATVARFHRARMVAALVSQDPAAIAGSGRRLGWSALVGMVITAGLLLAGVLPIAGD